MCFIIKIEKNSSSFYVYSSRAWSFFFYQQEGKSILIYKILLRVEQDNLNM